MAIWLKLNYSFLPERKGRRRWMLFEWGLSGFSAPLFLFSGIAFSLSLPPQERLAPSLYSVLVLSLLWEDGNHGRISVPTMIFPISLTLVLEEERERGRGEVKTIVRWSSLFWAARGSVKDILWSAPWALQSFHKFGSNLKNPPASHMAEGRNKSQFGKPVKMKEWITFSSWRARLLWIWANVFQSRDHLLMSAA